MESSLNRIQGRIIKILLYVLYFQSWQCYWFRFRSFRSNKRSNLPGGARSYLLFLPSVSIIRPLRSWFTARGCGYCPVTCESMMRALPHYRLRICRTVCRSAGAVYELPWQFMSMWRASHRTDLSHSTFVLYLTVNKYDRDISFAFIAVLPLILVLGTLNPGLKNLFILKRYKGVQVYCLLTYCTLYLIILYVLSIYFILYEA